MLLFSTDIDGTVYDGPESAQIFADFWRRRVANNPDLKLAYNTGRSLADTRALIASTPLPDPDFIISGVGTSICRFDEEAAMGSFLEALDFQWEFDAVVEVMGSVSQATMQPPECQNPYKCSWFWKDATRDQIEEVLTTLKSRGVTAQAVYSSNRDFDVLPISANKAAALKHLIAHLGIAADQVVVAGDSGNDAAMLSLAGTNSIVVANAEPALLESMGEHKFFHATKECAAGVIEGLDFYASTQSIS